MELKWCILSTGLFFFWLYVVRLNLSPLYTYGKPKEPLKHGNSSEWEQEQQRRKETLRSFCSGAKRPRKMLKKQALKDKSMLSHLLVDDNHRAIYCYIPKIGCSNWKRIWVKLRGDAEAASIDMIPQMRLHAMTGRMRLYQANSKGDAVKKKMETYTKFIVVRNPMERLISAYFDKIHHESPTSVFQAQVLPFVKRQRKNAHLKDISLEEFFSFASSPFGKRNEHWISYEKLCRPCQVDYDFILKLETIEEDAERLLRLIGAPPNIRYPHRSRKVTNSLAEIYLKNLTTKDIDGVIKNFYNDFKMFGYDLTL